MLIYTGTECKIVGLQFGSTEEKRKVYRAIEGLIALEKPDLIILVNDAWVKIMTKPDPIAMARIDEHGVSAEPDRTEAIIMIVSESTGPDRLISQPYHRDGSTIVWDPKPSEQFSDFTNKLLPPTWKIRPMVGAEKNN
jgi:hypothetical protein